MHRDFFNKINKRLHYLLLLILSKVDDVNITTDFWHFLSGYREQWKYPLIQLSAAWATDIGGGTRHWVVMFQPKRRGHLQPAGFQVFIVSHFKEGCHRKIINLVVRFLSRLLNTIEDVSKVISPIMDMRRQGRPFVVQSHRFIDNGEHMHCWGHGDCRHVACPKHLGQSWPILIDHTGQRSIVKGAHSSGSVVNSDYWHLYSTRSLRKLILIFILSVTLIFILSVIVSLPCVATTKTEWKLFGLLGWGCNLSMRFLNVKKSERSSGSTGLAGRQTGRLTHHNRHWRL